MQRILAFVLVLALGLAPLALDVSQANAAEHRSSELWHVTSVDDKTTGKFTYCAVESGFDNGLNLAFARNRDFNTNIVVTFAEHRLEEKTKFRMMVGIDNYPVRDVIGFSADGSTLVIPLQHDRKLLDWLQNGKLLELKGPQDSVKFALDGAGSALHQLELCVENNLKTETTSAGGRPVARPQVTTGPLASNAAPEDDQMMVNPLPLPPVTVAPEAASHPTIMAAPAAPVVADTQTAQADQARIDADKEQIAKAEAQKSLEAQDEQAAKAEAARLIAEREVAAKAKADQEATAKTAAAAAEAAKEQAARDDAAKAEAARIAAAKAKADQDAAAKIAAAAEAAREQAARDDAAKAEAAQIAAAKAKADQDAAAKVAAAAEAAREQAARDDAARAEAARIAAIKAKADQDMAAQIAAAKAETAKAEADRQEAAKAQAARDEAAKADAARIAAAKEQAARDERAKAEAARAEAARQEAAKAEAAKLAEATLEANDDSAAKAALAKLQAARAASAAAAATPPPQPVAPAKPVAPLVVASAAPVPAPATAPPAPAQPKAVAPSSPQASDMILDSEIAATATPAVQAASPPVQPKPAPIAVVASLPVQVPVPVTAPMPAATASAGSLSAMLQQAGITNAAERRAGSDYTWRAGTVTGTASETGARKPFIDAMLDDLDIQEKHCKGQFSSAISAPVERGGLTYSEVATGCGAGSGSAGVILYYEKSGRFGVVTQETELPGRDNAVVLRQRLEAELTTATNYK